MKIAVNALQNFSKSLYGPVLILPIVGLFIAFGNVFGNGKSAFAISPHYSEYWSTDR